MTEFAHEINCRGVVEVVTDYIEEALSLQEMQVVDRHLEGCEGCRRYLDQMRLTVQALGELRDEDVPPEMRERLLGAFREIKRR